LPDFARGRAKADDPEQAYQRSQKAAGGDCLTYAH
jgi:hypothetical protein